MKKLLILLCLIGLSYQSYSQESTKLFEVCYYLDHEPIIICIALPAVNDDSTKTVNDWFGSDDHKKYFKESSSVILKYSPDNVIYPIKEYKIK